MRIKDLCKLILRKRLKDSIETRKIMKKIINEYDYMKIDELLFNAGFKNDKNSTFYKNTLGEDFENSTCLTFVHKNVSKNLKVELSVYTDIKNMPNQFVVLLMYGAFKNKKLVRVLFGGEYHKEDYSKQKNEAFREFIQYFKLALGG